MNWIDRPFVERADIFLKFMNQRWSRTEELVNGMIKVPSNHGIYSGNLLDLCCGNGRIPVFMAKKRFRVVGADISKTFLDDAKGKAEEHGVSSLVAFLEGDIRNLKKFLKIVFHRSML